MRPNVSRALPRRRATWCRLGDVDHNDVPPTLLPAATGGDSRADRASTVMYGNAQNRCLAVDTSDSAHRFAFARA